MASKIKHKIFDLIKKELTSYLVKNALGGVASGVQFQVLKVVLDYLFDLYLEPVLEQCLKEGLIAYDLKKVREKLGEYENAQTRDDRIDRYNDIP
jgi:hypothetical protein